MSNSLEVTTARVVVIGGGVVGCSILYHLAKAGWTDDEVYEVAEYLNNKYYHFK